MIQGFWRNYKMCSDVKNLKLVLIGVNILLSEQTKFCHLLESKLVWENANFDLETECQY